MGKGGSYASAYIVLRHVLSFEHGVDFVSAKGFIYDTGRSTDITTERTAI